MRLGKKVDEKLRRKTEGMGNVPDTFLANGVEWCYEDRAKLRFVFYPAAEWEEDGRKEDRGEAGKTKEVREKETILRLGLNAGSGNLALLYWTELPLLAEWETETYDGIEIVEGI